VVVSISFQFPHCARKERRLAHTSEWVLLFRSLPRALFSRSLIAILAMVPSSDCIPTTCEFLVYENEELNGRDRKVKGSEPKYKRLSLC
jgi:hypothetical protein